VPQAREAALSATRKLTAVGRRAVQFMQRCPRVKRISRPYLRKCHLSGVFGLAMVLAMAVVSAMAMTVVSAMAMALAVVLAVGWRWRWRWSYRRRLHLKCSNVTRRSSLDQTRGRVDRKSAVAENCRDWKFGLPALMAGACPPGVHE